MSIGGSFDSPGGEILRAGNDLNIGPYTTEITEDNMNDVLAGTRAWVDNAIKEGRAGQTKPPVEDVDEILAYMQFTHQIEFVFNETLAPQPEIDIDEEEPDYQDGVPYGNPEIEGVDFGEIDDGTRIALDAMEQLEEGQFLDRKELDNHLINEAMASLLDNLGDAFSAGLTRHEIERAKAYLPAEIFSIVMARLGVSETTSLDGYEEEVSQQLLKSAAWHRDQQWLHSDKYYALRKAAYACINEGREDLGDYLLSLAGKHHTKKYEHIGIAAALERSALGIEWNFIPKKVRRSLQFLGDLPLGAF